MKHLSVEPRTASFGDGRLDSWKEIASYLRRSVRSVQRWEAEEGMPVHRHVHAKSGTVYAFAPELDAWWKERGAVLAEQKGAEETEPLAVEPATAEATGSSASPPSRGSTRSAGLAIGLTVAALAVGAGAWLSRKSSSPVIESGGRLPFQARDWVLVAAFENLTGEKLFDGTLDYALGRELSNSRHVTVVSHDRVRDALRLMRKPLDSRLDASLAREVCLRDGEIRALLTGRVEKLGSKYLFSVELVDPKSGTSLAGFSEESIGTNGSLAAMRRVSDRVRTALGETTPTEARGDGGLAKVTTSNLRALQLYSQADLLMGSATDSQAGAEELLRQAVAEDPDFASAYIHLAHAINNQDRPSEEYLPFAEKAFRLSQTTSDRERYFIRGSYYYFLGQRDKALAAWEALVSLHPDHGWAVGNLTALYELPEDLEKVVQIEARLADSYPRNFGFNWHAGYNFVVWKRDSARAGPYLKRAAELMTPEVVDEFRWAASWLALLPFKERWLRGDIDGASRELDRVGATLETRGRGPRDIFAVKTVLGYLTIGRTRAAERASEKILDPLVRNDMLVQISFLEGNARALQDHLNFPGERQLGVLSPGWWETTAILQARGGLVPEARRYLNAEQASDELAGGRGRLRAGAKSQDRAELHRVPGEIALARGNLGGTISELEAAMRLEPEWGRMKPGFYLGSESLASAWRRRGNLKHAIEILERASARRFQAVINDNSGPYWLRTRFQLARMYRSAGRVEEAGAIEAELRKLLVLADPDHPIILELRSPGSSP